MFKSLSDLAKLFGKESEALLANRYQVMNEIGHGAMGQVYRAIDTQSGDAPVAVKFLSQASMKHKMLKRFETEAKVSALLGEQSNHIVKVKDYGLIDEQTPYYVMEYLEGDDLDTVIQTKTISIARFFYLVRQICLGLECAHNGILVNGQLATIIHRDIKPSNIFLAKDEDERIICKILDFGIAQIHSDEPRDSQQKFMGTPEYCSPEQMAEYELKPTSDIYSLGVLMYEMLTQKTPITADNKSFQAWFKAHNETRPKPFPSYISLPPQVQDLIMRCLAKAPEDRPQSIKEILRIITPLERQYNYKESAVVESKKTLPSIFQNETQIKKLLPLQQIYKQSKWPNNKPQQKIVFPSLTDAQEGAFSSLWTMLESEEIKQFQPSSTFSFNHFLFQLKPHPVILWINLLYQHNYPPKWLPCYLDLKTEIGYQITNNLVYKGSYHILLFDLMNPEVYQQIFTLEITQEKLNQIESFILKSASISCNDDSFQISKNSLKQQFKKVQNHILSAIKKVRKK